MKYSILLFGIFFSFLLGGCTTQNLFVSRDISGFTLSGDIATGTDTDFSPQTTMNELLQGNIASGMSILGVKYNILISGNKLLYGDYFGINLPNSLETREYNNAAIERLSLSDATHRKHLTLTAASINGWRKDLSDKDKCTLEKYEEGVISKNITTTIQDNSTLYITQLTLSAFGETWEAGNVCFVDKDYIYSIEIGFYAKQYIQNIIDSFQFL